MGNPAQLRYSRVAIAFHWTIAALIVLNFLAAWIAEDAPKAEEQQIMANHMAIGLSVLALSVLRIVWRLLHPNPPYGETLKAWEAALARVVHSLFYLLMVALPLSGWAMVSAATGGKSVSLFGLASAPGLPFPQDRDQAELFNEVHELFATLMLLLIVLHVAAALKHQFVDRDATLDRMVPWRR